MTEIIARPQRDSNPQHLGFEAMLSTAAATAQGFLITITLECLSSLTRQLLLKRALARVNSNQCNVDAGFLFYDSRSFPKLCFFPKSIFTKKLNVRCVK